MRLAIIDCGTNTFHLLMVETEADALQRKIFNTRFPVKLGEGAINMGFIAAAPFERGIAALRQFNAYIQVHKADKIIAFATSALRDASNGKDFAEQIKRELNIELQIIDGDREAELIYLGNRQALPLSKDVSLIMDIGGGSTEFILANDTEILWKQSFNLGAARLLQRFNPSSPIKKEELDQIKKYIKDNLDPLYEAVKKWSPAEIVGSSGAFDSVVEIIHGELGGEELTLEKTGYSIDLKQYETISALIKNADLIQRKQIKGLTPMRFDMIVISFILIDFILKEFDLKVMRVSTYSLKEGAYFDFISKQAK
ncbi:MAG: phosphatase [Bacteroidetes bacterium]|nr:phosphatase [Bacteroidota bacterium]